VSFTQPISDSDKVEPALRPPRRFAGAYEDLREGLGRWRLAMWLGWRDAVLPMRRAKIGLFWVTIQSGLWVLVIAGLLGPSLGASEPFYPVYVAAGVVFFQFLTSMITDGAATFIRDASLIQNIPNPLSLYVLRVVFKALILLAAQMPIIAIAYVFVPEGLTWTLVWAAPALICVIFSLTGVILFLASITPLYRDIPFMIAAGMRVMFFATPVFWLVNTRGGLRQTVAAWNPLAHFLSLVRDPFIGAVPSVHSTAIVIGCGVVMWIIGFYSFSRTRTLVAMYL
jgi:ABC-type polysaccharide/polyol phosphate export permease